MMANDSIQLPPNQVCPGISTCTEVMRVMRMMEIQGLMVQMVERGMLDKPRDDGWSVDGSGGWRVDSRSPKNKKLGHKKTKSGIKGDLQDQ